MPKSIEDIDRQIAALKEQKKGKKRLGEVLEELPEAEALARRASRART